MRDIKFRAWNGDRFELGAFNFKTGCLGCNFSTYVEIDSPQQFTGLKDINGVEIYDGDVVVDSEFITKRGYPVEHGKFDAQVQGSVCEVICIGFHVDGSPLNPTGEYEVIGNIYENPELLK